MSLELAQEIQRVYCAQSVMLRDQRSGSNGRISEIYSSSKGATESDANNSNGQHQFMAPISITSQRVGRRRYPPDFLSNLPDGVTYNDPAKISNRSYSDHQSDLEDPDIVVIGDFTINIDKIRKESLIGMRKYLPSDEYRLLKNRKSARLCRQRRKEERGGMQEKID